MDDRVFEQEVRRVARELWPAAELGGAQNVAARERDGLYATADAIYVIEATVSRKKEKIDINSKKTSDTVKNLRKNSGKFSKGYIVTLYDPTADQNQVARKYDRYLELLSFDQFCSKLFNASLYLSLRDRTPFGSVQDIATTDQNVPRGEFVEPTIDDGNNLKSVDLLQFDISIGRRFCLVAEFGSGKSMLSREAYYRLRDRYLKKQALQFLVYINLRDHSGAEYNVEILERHARKVGYPEPSHLVRAWRAGFVHLILDGFDEMIGRGVSPTPAAMREYRRRIIRPVNQLIRESQKTTGILICGRAGFFDTAAERAETLGISSGFETIYVRPFNERQITELLKLRHVTREIPGWLPRTPLLLSYLVSRGYLSEFSEEESKDLNRGRAWIALIDMICAREAAQSISLDTASTKLFFERLSTKSRSALQGSATLNSNVISTVFREIARREPIEDDWQLILRLPGLGPTQGGNSERMFIDNDLCAAGAAGDLVRFIENPFDPDSKTHLVDVVAPLGELGVEVTCEYLIRDGSMNEGVLSTALENSSRTKLYETAIDVISTLRVNEFLYRGAGVDILDGHIDDMDLSTMPLGMNKVQIYGTYVRSAYMPINTEDARIPKFRDCWFGEFIGRLSELDLPGGKFENCTFDRFAAAFSIEDEVYDEYPVALQALIACLQRLFFQAGSGRLESAFSRGLGDRVALLIPEVLKLISAHKFASPMRLRGRTIWLPNRELTSRASEIVNKPSISKDPLIIACKDLK